MEPVSVIEPHEGHKVDTASIISLDVDIKLASNGNADQDHIPTSNTVPDQVGVEVKVEVQLPPPPPPPPTKAPRNSPLDWLYCGVQYPAGEISVDSISPCDVPVSTKDGFETLCSYNWVDDEVPTIYVPGGAPKFTPHAFPVRLEPDNGVSFRDLNRAKSRRQPLKGVFTALTAMSPEAKLDDVDVVITRGGFQTLFKFAKSGTSTPFVLQMNLIMNKTLILTYREERNKSYSSGRTAPNWGHAFEEGFTTYDDELRGSIAHHRVIKYQFGNLKVAVVHEVDASYPASCELSDPATVPEGEPTILAKRPGAADLQHSQRTNEDIKVLRAGSGTAPEAIAEMKSTTKAFWQYGPDWRKQEQCWFGRTSIILNGRHTDGVFQSIAMKEIDFEPWAEDHQEGLRKTVSLFEMLRERTRLMKNSGIALLNHTVCKTRLEIWTPNRLVVCNPIEVDTVRRHWSNGYEGQRYSSQRYSSQRHSSQHHPSKPYPSHHYQKQRHSSERYSSERHSSQRYPDQRHPSERFPSDPHPSGILGHDRYPSSPYSSVPSRSQHHSFERQASEPQTNKRQASERHPSERHTSKRQASGYRPSETRGSEGQFSERRRDERHPSNSHPSGLFGYDR